MNWKSVRVLALAVASTLAVAGCTKEAPNDVAEGISGGGNATGERIKLDLSLEDLSGDLEQDELRMVIENIPRPGSTDKYNGVKFIFTDGETVKLHTYFRQGTTKKVGTPIDIKIEGSTISTTVNGVAQSAWIAEGELVVPAGIDLTDGSPDVYVSGAIGVTEIDRNGKAKIDAANVAIDAENQDVSSVVPMYFPEMKLDKKNKTLSFDDVATKTRVRPHLRFYGALVELTLKNNMYDPLMLNQVVMRTDAFTTSGTMDLTTTRGGAEPSWEAVAFPTKWIKLDANGNPISTGRQQEVEIEEVILGKVVKTKVKVDIYATEDSEDQRVSFSPEVLKRGGTKKAFIWVKPTAYQNLRSMKLWVREGDYTYAPEARNEAIARNYSVKALETKVYRLPVVNAIPNPELIYTEHRRQALRFMWEIYNPTNQQVDLSQYYQNRLKWINNNRMDVMKSTQLTDPSGKTLALAYSKNGGWKNREIDFGPHLRRNPLPNNMYLKPGEMIVYMTWDLGSDAEIRSQIASRNNVAYVVYFDGHNIGMPNAFVGDASYHDMYVLTKGSVVQPSGLRIGTDNVADSFFYFDSPGSRRRTNEVSYVRRPDRTFGRKFWANGEDGPNCDWVYRTLNSRDIGYRFSWYASAGARNGGLPLDTRDGNNFFVYLRHGGISYNSFRVPAIWTYEYASSR